MKVNYERIQDMAIAGYEEAIAQRDLLSRDKDTYSSESGEWLGWELAEAFYLRDLGYTY